MGKKGEIKMQEWNKMMGINTKEKRGPDFNKGLEKLKNQIEHGGNYEDHGPKLLNKIQKYYPMDESLRDKLISQIYELMPELVAKYENNTKFNYLDQERAGLKRVRNEVKKFFEENKEFFEEISQYGVTSEICFNSIGNIKAALKEQKGFKLDQSIPGASMEAREQYNEWYKKRFIKTLALFDRLLNMTEHMALHGYKFKLSSEADTFYEGTLYDSLPEGELDLGLYGKMYYSNQRRELKELLNKLQMSI